MNSSNPTRSAIVDASRRQRWPWLSLGLCFMVLASFGQATNSTAVPLTAPALPDAGLSLFRVMGALALVLALFFGGVWLFRNWQRLSIQRGRAPKLNLVETRSLGARSALYVVGYERERFLVAASPSGINLLSHLPAASEEEAAAKTGTAPTMSFGQALTEVLKRK